MSHFAVLVIGENTEEQLAPYEEDTSNLPKHLLTFHDQEEEMLHEYEHDTVERVVMPDGSLVSPHDDRFLVKGKDPFDTKHEVPKDLEVKRVPYKQLYPSLEAFAEGYHGYRARDEEEGRYGYWRNDNAKWDWYQLGGRWTGFFKLKKKVSERAVVGEPSLVSSHRAKVRTADQCLKGDVDWKKMMAEAGKEAGKYYDRLTEVVAGRPVPNWDQTREKNASIEDARNEYWSNPVIKDLQKEQLLGFSSEVDKILAKPREQYVDFCAKSSILPYAIVKDGKWYQKGEMGWWGISTDEMDPEVWVTMATKLIMELPDDTLLSLFDCHI
jgi:hypothetical protein